MIPDWTGNVVGRMHVYGISIQQLAQESGYSYSYVSAALHGSKASEKSDRTRQKIIEALERLEERARREADALDGTG